MPRTYKYRPKHRFNTNRKPPPPLPIKDPANTSNNVGNSIFSSIVQGFSFGTGSQLAREAFSSSNNKSGGEYNNESNDTPLSTNNITKNKNECDVLKEQLFKCNEQYIHDCEYLTRYIESKCKDTN